MFKATELYLTLQKNPDYVTDVNHISHLRSPLISQINTLYIDLI